MFTLEQWHSDLVARDKILDLRDLLRANQEDLAQMTLGSAEHRHTSGVIFGIEESIKIWEGK